MRIFLFEEHVFRLRPPLTTPTVVPVGPLASCLLAHRLVVPVSAVVDRVARPHFRQPRFPDEPHLAVVQVEEVADKLILAFDPQILIETIPARLRQRPHPASGSGVWIRFGEDQGTPRSAAALAHGPLAQVLQLFPAELLVRGDRPHDVS